MNALSYRRRRQAFTLLEVILALALSAVVIYLIAGALDFHLRQLTIRKSRIEEAQLARAVLRRIADDLRAVVVDRPIDFSAVAQLASSAGRSGGNSQPGDDNAGDDADDTSSAALDIIDSTLLPATPGVYGNAYELQVDISRIPRYEEYAIVEQANDLQALRLLSDVKTVSYFLVGQSGIGATSQVSAGVGMSTANYASTAGAADYAMLGLPPGQPLQGLGRRVVDRAATRYALNNADFSFLDQQTELFAPEVVFLQFRYFDGLQWVYEWDSEQLGGIPLAVEIVVVLQPRDDSLPENRASLRSTSSSSDTLWQFDPNHVYRLVVHLPAAEMIDTTAPADGVGTDPQGAP
jgi:prepilin-type N-terminal cleavage/methylation domain-containing protein